MLLEVVAYRQHELLVGKNKTSRFDKNVTSSPETFLVSVNLKINVKSTLSQAKYNRYFEDA